ncbi:hypothetical protein CNR22_07855 [Sphingobacteriaceae bacterium]|nr:hypothetical protein CNR22_07855 [Sphingobacteriaceae bacterium]
MKHPIFKYASIVILFLIPIAITFSGCAKDPDEPADETPDTPAATTPKFTWTLSGSTLVTADDSYFVSQFSNIYASKTNGMSVDINLSDLNTGNHTIAPSNGVTLEYTSTTTTLNATSGSVVISENTGTSVSGSFTCNLSGGGSTSTIIGDFIHLPKK